MSEQSKPDTESLSDHDLNLLIAELQASAVQKKDAAARIDLEMKPFQDWIDLLIAERDALLQGANAAKAQMWGLRTVLSTREGTRRHLALIHERSQEMSTDSEIFEKSEDPIAQGVSRVLRHVVQTPTWMDMIALLDQQKIDTAPHQKLLIEAKDDNCRVGIGGNRRYIVDYFLKYDPPDDIQEALQRAIAFAQSSIPQSEVKIKHYYLGFDVGHGETGTDVAPLVVEWSTHEGEYYRAIPGIDNTLLLPLKHRVSEILLTGRIQLPEHLRPFENE